MPVASSPSSPFVPESATSFSLLIVDHDDALHHEYRRILGAKPKDGVPLLEESSPDTFGRLDQAFPPTPYQTTHAYDGDEALEFARAGILGGSHYAVAFVDMCMTSGLDGIETTRKLWAVDAMIQVVLCTSYADFSWQETIERTGRGDGLHLLRKPFRAGQVSRFADTLCRKWLLQRARVTPWALSGS